jgi:SnoaL-like domain
MSKETGMEAIDYEEIRQLLGHYNLAIDLGDPDAWAACFTPDGVFECRGVPDGSPFGGRHAGAVALRAYAATHFGIAKGNARHWNANLVIDGDGTAATMTCYMLALSVGGAGLAGSTGIYRDELRKVDGSWLFTSRLITLDPARPPKP